jgi:hypothetical protein
MTVPNRNSPAAGNGKPVVTAQLPKHNISSYQPNSGTVRPSFDLYSLVGRLINFNSCLFYLSLESVSTSTSRICHANTRVRSVSGARRLVRGGRETRCHP